MVEKPNVVSIAKPDGFDLSKFRSKRAAAVQNRYWNVSELEAGEQRCAAPRAEGARQDRERRRRDRRQSHAGICRTIGYRGRHQ